ncbi:MAG: nickel-dependent lactate racemase [Candidatus Bathyarchaeota archaeon]|nr:MAG: nickel-dependent lactate racemase [Candidatus Bathyarchaeota archaeon]
MPVKLPYGNSEIEFDIDSNRVSDLLTPSEVVPAKNPLFEVERALETPLEGPTIEDLAPRGKTVAIAVDDITRTTPTNLLLPPILDKLKSSGTSKDDIKVLVALGTHRRMTEREMKEKYGAEIVEDYEFVNHDFDDETQLMYLGDIAGEVPVWINKAFLKADIRIVTGNVIPHFNAGWGAGAKILLPGLAGEETVGRMHVYSAMTTPNGLGMEENPTRKLIDAFAEKVKIHLLINSVITRYREIIKVYAGHFVKAHRIGVQHAKQVYGVPMRELADITISSSHPADIEYWQGLKGLFSADLSTKVEGGIIEATPCPEGIAVMHPKWIEYLQYGTEELKEMYRTGEIEDFVAFGLALNVAHVREKHPVCIISDGISEKQAEKMRFQKFGQIEEAVDMLTRRYGSDSKINILTHGGEIYPVSK